MRPAWVLVCAVACGGGHGTPRPLDGPVDVFAPDSSDAPSCGFAITTFPALSSPGAITVGDVTGDGKLDVVVASASALDVLPGQGSASFGSPIETTVGVPVRAFCNTLIAAGDLNADSAADLVAAGSQGVSVLVSNRDGTFQAHVDYSLPFIPCSVAIADVNTDGKADIIAVSDGPGLAVLIGNGDATFQLEATPISDSPSGQHSVLAADLNGDSKPDLVLGLNAAVGTRLGNGDGTFQPVVEQAASPVSAAGWTLAVTDFNRDGHIDVAAGIYTNNVFLGNGDGTLQPAIGVAAGSEGGFFIAAGDVTGDGNPDVIAAGYNASDPYMVAGYGDGTFDNHTKFYDVQGAAIAAMASADLDGDGRLDVVAAAQAQSGVVLVLHDQCP